MDALPSRVVNLEAARNAHGSVADRLMPALNRMDPLGDAAARALSDLGDKKAVDRALCGDRAGIPSDVLALVDDASRWPVWADERRADGAGELLFRSGLAGGVVLGAKSLLAGYTSPAGNKPLIWSGRLRSNVSRRLAETAKFVAAVAEPGGLRPGAEGFRITLKVRLIHAQVRALIERTGGWRLEEWGAPINQHDMVATILLFSNAWLDGVEALGIHTSTDEVEDYVHLWRIAGHIMGVEHDLLPATRAEGDRLAEVIALTQAPPDDDSRALVQSFLQHPIDAATNDRERRLATRRMQINSGLVRGLLGDETADQLGLTKDGWRFAVPAMREIVRRAERIRRGLPGGNRLAVQAGRQHWEKVLELGLDGIPADFALPRTLFGLSGERAA